MTDHIDALHWKFTRTKRGQPVPLILFEQRDALRKRLREPPTMEETAAELVSIAKRCECRGWCLGCGEDGDDRSSCDCCSIAELEAVPGISSGYPSRLCEECFVGAGFSCEQYAASPQGLHALAVQRAYAQAPAHGTPIP